MNRQSTKQTLPILTSASPPTGEAVNVSDAQNDIVVQIVGIANSVAYSIEASCDEGTTWVDVTKSFTDMSVGTALAGAIAADGMFRAPAFAGQLHVKCTTPASGGEPTVRAYINRQVIG